MKRRELLSKLTRILVISLFGLALRAGGPAPASQAIIIDHTCTKLASIPAEWIHKAKEILHIAYGCTSHGSQLLFGMTGLSKWKGPLYSWNTGGSGGALELRGYIGDFAGLGIANDLNSTPSGSTSYTAWEKATRAYLAADPGVNVIMWSWCWGANTSFENIDTYLSLMNKIEKDFPNIKFVYMTGRTMAASVYTTDDAACNQRIRKYCEANRKILYDFYDIECYDPDGVYFGDKHVNENCDYDGNGDGARDRNWAIDWQNAHPGEWFPCEAPHTQPLNANMKAYAAWWLWARLAGWDGRTG